MLTLHLFCTTVWCTLNFWALKCKKPWTFVKCKMQHWHLQHVWWQLSSRGQKGKLFNWQWETSPWIFRGITFLKNPAYTRPLWVHFLTKVPIRKVQRCMCLKVAFVAVQQGQLCRGDALHCTTLEEHQCLAHSQARAQWIIVVVKTLIFFSFENSRPCSHLLPSKKGGEQL